MINTVLDGLAANGVDGNKALEKEVREKVRTLCARFPIYSGL
jgi:glycine hydroxymethyltransferase